MKIQFEADKLASQLRLIRASLAPSKGMPGEDVIGLGAKDGKLIAYAYAKGCWVRVVVDCDVSEHGVVIIDRARFFKLLEALKEEVNFKTLPNGKQVEISMQKTAGKFHLTTSTTEMPRPRLDPSTPITLFDARPLRDQLTLNILDGELSGGGYRVATEYERLKVMATDRQRLVLTEQHIGPDVNIQLSIHHAAVKGVFEVLKVADKVEIRSSANLTSFTALLEDGSSVEFGYRNTVEEFPDIHKLLTANFVNHAQFEVGDLVQAITRADALADEELPHADFNFEHTEACILSAVNNDGSAVLGIDCPSEVEDSTTTILRLQLPHLKSLLNKAKACGAAWVTCQWGSEKMPVKWNFDFEEAEDHRYSNIEMTYLTAAINRNV